MSRKQPETVQAPGKDFASRLFDLSYRHTEEIRDYLIHTGALESEDSQNALWAFFEIVVFVYGWMESACLVRVHRERRDAFDAVLSEIARAWGRFFAEYPPGPTLGTGAADLANRIRQRSARDRASYRKILESRGATHALNHHCAIFLSNVKLRALGPGTAPKGRDLVLERDEHLIRRMGEFAQTLVREVDVVLVEGPFGNHGQAG